MFLLFDIITRGRNYVDDGQRRNATRTVIHGADGIDLSRYCCYASRIDADL